MPDSDLTITVIYTPVLDNNENGIADQEEEFTVKFVDEDGTVLQSESIAYGEMPEYKGEEPSKEATVEYTYTFTGWDKDIVNVTEDVTYTATYSSKINEYVVAFNPGQNGTFSPISELMVYNVAYGETIAQNNIQIPTIEGKTGYRFAGWELNGNIVSDENIMNTVVTGSITYTAKYEALQVGISVRPKPNVQFVFQKGSTPDLASLIDVYEVYADGSELLTTSYTNDLDTSSVVDNKTLTITENGFTDTSISYKIKNEVASQSQFEVIYNSSNTFKQTKNRSCTKDCDTDSKTEDKTLNHNFLEIIEHYEQNISISNIKVNYTNNTSKTLNNVYSNSIRWSYVESSGWFGNSSIYDPVYIYAVKDNNNFTNVTDEENIIDTVEITYNRKGYGTYTVVFKNNNNVYTAIDEIKK